MARSTDLESHPSTGRRGAPSSVPPNDETPEPRRRIRRSWFGKLFGGVGWMLSGPVDWAATKSIARAGALIRGLSIAARSRRPRDSRFKLEPEGGFDLTATAFCLGLSVSELQRRLTARRRRTAQIAYLMFGLACLALLAWIRAALMSPWTFQLSDQDAADRWLVRVFDDERGVLATLRTVTSFHPLFPATCGPAAIALRGRLRHPLREPSG
jgi:hypothetical protein